MNHFNLKSVKVANPITRQRVVDRGQDIVKIKIKHNENIVEKWNVVCGSRYEYTEGFLDKQNIITYIKTQVSVNKNLFDLCTNMDKKIEITRYKLENNKKTLIDTDKKLVLSNMEARAFLKRAERTVLNRDIK